MNTLHSKAMHSTDSDSRIVQQHEQYRTVSKAAVVCIVFAVMAILAFAFPAAVIMPFLSICFGISALISFKRFPNELTGKTAARIGTAVSTIILVAAVSMHAYIYATEVPEGYRRISFYDLKPDRRTQLEFAEKAEDFEGEMVFVKGYVRPGLKKNRLKKFILVGDFGSCCFGGNPEITDVVAVSIKNEDDYVNYGYRLRRVGGEFKLHRRPKMVREKDLPKVLYEIEADYIK